jgi:predicted ATPase
VLTAILLDGFRCFPEPTRVTLGPLTVLAGANSAGKSSAIHALLALMQSEQQPVVPYLRLSGDWVDIGSFTQALTYARQGEARRFTLGMSSRVDGREMDLALTLAEPEAPGDRTAKIARIEACVDDAEYAFEPVTSEFRGLRRRAGSEDWEDAGVYYHRYPWSKPLIPTAPLTLIAASPASVLYLSAFRDLPRALYAPRRTPLGPLLGTMGEHVAETLFSRRNQETEIVPGAGPPLLLGPALRAWWGHVFGGEYVIRAEAAEDLGYTISLDTPSAENLRLTQVGTGLSQALPVIVLGLCSKPGDLVVVESPELQLHPAAQHRLMDLFVALARAGRQVILETHSDHVVHAIQLAVKLGQLSPDDVAMRFFSQEDGAARVEAVPIDAQGRMQKQPVGFVDQASADLLELIR